MTTKGWRMSKKKIRRQLEAEKRNLTWTTLTKEEKLAIINTHPGESKKERAKLNVEESKQVSDS